jgi:hypothetical protein
MSILSKYSLDIDNIFCCLKNFGQTCDVEWANRLIITLKQALIIFQKI